MNDAEIIRRIDAGANHYISLLGNAAHMVCHDTGHYSYVHPKAGEQGISFVYDIRVDDLDAAAQQTIAAEIKALNVPFWLNLQASDDVFRLFFGKEKLHGQTAFALDDEQYMAMMPEAFVDFTVDQPIVEVRTPEQFAVWTKIANDILAGGRTDVHPIHHYPLIQQGKMHCYTLYCGDMPASVACIMTCDGTASLELVATLPEYRRRGFARAVCAKALREEITCGAALLTVRANGAASASVYRSLGFQVYNHAL